jgi:hypothetical protein
MLFQVVADAFHVRDRGKRPANTHLRAEHLFKAGVHLLFFDELAPVGAGFAFLHGGSKTRVFIEQAQLPYSHFLTIHVP